MPAVLAGLEAAGLIPASVTVARPSLDDVYLRHTGRAFTVEPDPRAGRSGPMSALVPARPALGAAVSDPVYLAGRGVRALLRQPWFVAITLVQPVVWLLLFGALFEHLVPSPTGDYLAYLTPGIVVMSALFSNGWAGMGFITDAERGVMDRLPVSPVRRGSVMAGSLLNQQVTTVVQTAVILGLGLAVGARFPGGAPVMLVFVGSVVLLGAAFASYSNALALLLRSQESVIGAVNFVVLPLSFLSSMLVPTERCPAGSRRSRGGTRWSGPVVVGRQTLSPDVDWGLVGTGSPRWRRWRWRRRRWPPVRSPRTSAPYSLVPSTGSLLTRSTAHGILDCWRTRCASPLRAEEKAVRAHVHPRSPARSPARGTSSTRPTWSSAGWRARWRSCCGASKSRSSRRTSTPATSSSSSTPPTS